MTRTPKATTSCHSADIHRSGIASNDPEQEAAEHGAADVADASEHRGGEGLEPGDEAHRVDDAELHARTGIPPRRP